MAGALTTVRADVFFNELENLPVGRLDDIASGGGLVVVAPHPDDESLGCGGLIAQARRTGRDVRIVVVSDGCGSHPNSRLYPAERLRALRESETLRAVSELGLPHENVRFLRLPDSGVPRDGLQAQEAANAVVQAARDCAAGAVLVTWRHDPHCDHGAAAAIVDLARPELAGARIFAYPVWGWVLPPDAEVGPEPCGMRLDIHADRDAKRRAIAAHVSQTTDLVADDPGGFRLDPAMIERLCGRYEAFIEVAP